MTPCSTRPPLIPVFDPACIGSCSEIALVPGCLDPANFYVEQYCTDEEVVTCFGTGTIRVPSRWNIVGFDGFGQVDADKTGVWESGVLELTPTCEEDIGENPMIIKVSRAPEDMVILPSCLDVYGIEQGPLKITIPSIIEVCVTRDGTTSAPCPI